MFLLRRYTKTSFKKHATYSNYLWISPPPSPPNQDHVMVSCASMRMEYRYISMLKRPRDLPVAVNHSKFRVQVFFMLHWIMVLGNWNSSVIFEVGNWVYFPNFVFSLNMICCKTFNWKISFVNFFYERFVSLKWILDEWLHVLITNMRNFDL